MLRWCHAILFALAFFTAKSQALEIQNGIFPEKTKLIYSANDKSINIKVNNKTQGDYLLQAVIQPADLLTGLVARKMGNVPLVITSPVQRSSPGDISTFKIIARPSVTRSLSKTQESLFYLTIRMIPEGRKAGSDVLRLVSEYHIRIFWRPAELASKKQNDRGGALTFSWHDGQLVVTNLSGYIVEFVDLSLTDVAVERRHLIVPVPPHKSVVYSLAHQLSNIDGTVKWRIRDDNGCPSNPFVRNIR